MSVRLTPLIIYARRFERCLRFYRKVFNLRPTKIYRGKQHPRWAQFQLGDVMFALHSGYHGPPYQGDPVWIHFQVKDIRTVIRRIKEFGGLVTRPPRKVEHFPEGWSVLVAHFADPDGNQFTVQEILKEL